MKRNYLIEVHFSLSDDEDFISQQSYQRMAISRLMEKEVIITHAMSTDNSRLWMVMRAGNEDSVYKILQKLPLFNYMHIQIYELTPDDSPMFALPRLSMN
ncbi:MAG: hypothetical protein IAE67_07475 [Candidatus Competibacteraceae bacterium]|nr:hypothetical protein [Candidatus Competibacteraceae bacterium]